MKNRPTSGSAFPSPVAAPAAIPPQPTPPPKTDEKRRIFLVDDHPVTRQGVAALINSERDLTVCGEADSAPAALAQIQKVKPDLVIADIMLKSTSGIELIKNARVLDPNLLILVMSM